MDSDFIIVSAQVNNEIFMNSKNDEKTQQLKTYGSFVNQYRIQSLDNLLHQHTKFTQLKNAQHLEILYFEIL